MRLNSSDLGLIPSSGENLELDFIHGFGNTSTNHAGCTKTICVNGPKLDHLGPMYEFELK